MPEVHNLRHPFGPSENSRVLVILAKAGISRFDAGLQNRETPAFARVTDGG
jgi:hypothetical protein